MLFSRADATPATDVPHARQIMPFIMRTRTESTVYFEQHIDLTRTQPFIDGWNAAHPDQKISVFHVFLWAAVEALNERPRLNRFVMGSRLWQRTGIHLSFSAKKRLDDHAPIVVIKREFEPGQTFEQLVDFVYADVREGRSDKKSHVDKELNLFLSLPAPLLRLGVRVLRWLDDVNLLPHSFIAPDPMYCSMFVANLGSVKLDSAFHHLYEWGNCPFFAAIGQTQTVLTPEGPRLMCSIKYSFDERVEDGLYCAKALELLRKRLEDPLQRSQS